MPNHRLLLEYDGTDYHGWQRQPGLATVQGALEEALSKVARLSSPLYVAGRTDAGVHARGQVVNFHGEIKPVSHRLPNALNAFLPRDVVVKACEEVPENFDARRSALAREYIYYVHRGTYPSPFNRRYAYHCRDDLDLEAIEQVLGVIEGEHDFTAFSRSEEGKSSVREVYEAELLRDGDILGIRVRANAFVWMMMRMLCGGLLEAGRGRWTAEFFREVLDGGDDSARVPALPPCGLFLEKVCY